MVQKYAIRQEMVAETQETTKPEKVDEEEDKVRYCPLPLR